MKCVFALFRLWCVACFWVVLYGHVQAQENFASPKILEGAGAASFDPLFEKILQNPDAVELNLAFARRAIALEDFEAAIATLERLLIGRAGLPLIRLELGMLYLRLEAPELAQAYFRQAIDDPTLAPDAKIRAETLLAAARKAGRRNSFAMSLRISAQHQSNAVTKPVLGDIQSQNELRQAINPTWPDLSNQSLPNLTADSDNSTQIALGISYSRALNGLTKRRFTAGLHYFTMRYSDENLQPLNIDVTSLRLGWLLPHANLPFSYNPYMSATTLDTQETGNYSSSAAVGFSVNSQFFARVPMAFGVEAKLKHHKRASDEDKDGEHYNMVLNFGYIHAAGAYSALAIKADTMQADTDYESASGNSVTLNHSWQFGGLDFTGNLGWRDNKRDGLEVLQNGVPVPDIIRHDEDLMVGFVVARKILGIGVALGINYIERDSTLPEQRYDNVTSSLSLTRRFQ